MRRRLLTIFVFWIFASGTSLRAFAEDAPKTDGPSTSDADKVQVATPPEKANITKEAEPESPLAAEQKAERKAGVARLIKKFTRDDGKAAPIAVLTPLDYTTLNFAELAQETILASLEKYGKFDVRVIDYTPSALTLEEFRKVVTKYNVDIVVLSVLKPTNFDVFLYDRRTPYNIYAHSETLPEAVQYQLTKQVVEEYTKVIVRRALFAFMQEQFFELPREESRTFLTAEIPRFIASGKSFEIVNREILSNYYAAFSVGGALSAGGSGLWTSNLVGLQFGTKVFNNYFAELNIDMFSYNAVGPALKYMFANRDNPFRFTAGLGIAMLSNSHVINWDQAHTQGTGGNYIVPSVAFSFPIVDLHVKIESKLFVSLDGSKFVLTVMPGMLFMF